MILMLIFAIAYYRIAAMDNRNGFLWAAISIAFWYGGAYAYGFAGALIGQAMPFVLMMVGNMMKK